jgi:hypothetical protein
MMQSGQDVSCPLAFHHRQGRAAIEGTCLYKRRPPRSLKTLFASC